MTIDSREAWAAVSRSAVASGHRLFGFHDVSPWNADCSQMLAIEVDAIDHPPLSEAPARVGVIDVESQSFRQHDTTTGWNFPQGSRQLWLFDRSRYAYNCPDGDQPRTRIRDQSGRLIRELPWGVAAVGAASDILYSIDFGRVHRAGGYGHTGSRPWSSGDPIERAGGLVSVEIGSGAAKTLASLADCRGITGRPGVSADQAGSLDYVTHVVPSPSGKRVSFLYRSWYADGGIDTALCVVDSDGANLRMVLRGNLSHFDWRDEDSIVIWGPRGRTITKLRGKGGGRRGLATLVLKIAKDVLRPIVRRSGMLASAYLHVPLDGSPPKPFFQEILTGDGHPSFCPSKREWMLADTYPNSAGERELFLVNTTKGDKHSLGIFTEPKMQVNPAKSQAAMAEVDPAILRIIGKDLYSFTRSGLHCDLHPRWRSDGKQVTFDSLHEGSRQIYVVDTAGIVE
jgi:hypothetical protein